MTRKLYRGQYGTGYSAVAIARLMGCSRTTALSYLYAFKREYGRNVNDDEIGTLVQLYRNSKSEKKIKRWLA